MCVSPVLARRSIPVPAAALGPRTTRVRLRTGQLCLGSHFSVTEGADHGAEAGPKSVPANPPLPLPACVPRKPLQGSPGRIQTWASPPPFVPLAFKAGQEPLLLLSARSQPRASPCHLAQRLGSLLRECVCVCVCVCVCSHSRVYLWLCVTVYACAFV